ncbi:MAG: AMP-binding protein [Pseudomonadota bacterium]
MNQALDSPGREACSHLQLAKCVEGTIGKLIDIGIGPGDAVAIAMPNGPEMAILFLAVSTIACAAPLNPAYREAELAFYLGDMDAKLLICPKDGFETAKSVANSRGMLVAEVELGRDASCASLNIDLPVGKMDTYRSYHANQPGDVALLLHTSGTTAKPKLVGLTRANIEASIRNIIATLDLSPADKGLSILPLFHIHGLMATLCAPLLSGGSVVCTEGFDALRFFRWMDAFRPTWFSAVPSMHQAIVRRAQRNSEIVEQASLRFVRSSSAALAPATLKGLEETFRCPVVEAYGMTEAAHQITSNSLDRQQPGSVGWQKGTQVRVVNDLWESVPPGSAGNIVIRGDNIHAGYINAPAENDKSFRDDWFDTGDQGFLDSQGCLTITGRKKELINRGGEKIAPLEIDAILAQDGRIAEAITFGIPHRSLGEDIAVAVVPAEGQALTADTVKLSLAEVLAAHKVPRTVVFLDVIPKGPTGKIQRLKLAEMLGFANR